jgi:hypothetical protein
MAEPCSCGADGQLAHALVVFHDESGLARVQIDVPRGAGGSRGGVPWPPDCLTKPKTMARHSPVPRLFSLV